MRNIYINILDSRIFILPFIQPPKKKKNIKISYNCVFTYYYPLTTTFINSNPYILYPNNILMTVLARDVELKNMVKKWITETIDYQKRALDKMDERYEQISWYK